MAETKKMADIADRLAKSGKTGEILFKIESGDSSFSWTFGKSEQPFFIASATKLFVVAILAKLREAGKLNWDLSIKQYLPDLDLSSLHLFRGADYTDQITIRHLLAHTSGLPDYFEGKRSDGAPLFQKVMKQDQAWSLKDVVHWSREFQRPHFQPGAPNKAQYSDTGYQLLGGIIEHIYAASFADVVKQEIADPLELKDTYCFSPLVLSRYEEVSILFSGRSKLNIPQAMASVGADGGVVSTLNDSMRFIRAFMNAELFSQQILDEIQSNWHSIFFPLQYGLGVMRFEVPWIFSPFKRFPSVVGHSGASGALLFYCQEWDLYLVGTVNQVENRSLSFQTMIQLLAQAKKSHPI